MQENTENNFTINERLIYFVDFLGVKRYKFSKETGISESVLLNIYKGKNKPSVDLLNKIVVRYPVLNINWILTGKGSMLNDDSGLKNTITESKVNEPASILTKPPGYECALCVQKNITIDALQRLSLVQQKTIDLLNARVEELEKNDSTDDGQKRKAV